VHGGHTFAEIGVGGGFTCGRNTAGGVLCWGSNFRFSVAAPLDSSIVLVPRLVQSLQGITQLQTGGLHSCVLDGAGQGQCWGDNTASQLGSGIDNDYPYAILSMSGGNSFRMIEAGEAHTCGITIAGLTLCWGTMGGRSPAPVMGQPH
jgi:alpha-tubulin suppressor-like RCC1 family protein